jgi:uncharacterized integral membrane protein
MALSLAEDPASLPGEKKKKAFLHLVITIFVIDTLAIIAYLVLVYIFGLEGMLPLGLLILASVFTGVYLQAGKQKIEK